MNSSTRRDLPTPAAPSTVTRWQALCSPPPSNGIDRAASCRSRPTSGDVEPRGARRRRARPTASSRLASTPSARLGVDDPSRTSRCVGSSIRISPGGGQLLEALGRVHRVARWRAGAPGAAITSPVATPTRRAERPRTRARARRRSRAASGELDRGADRATASSSCSSGTPKTAISDVAGIVSTLPPCRSSDAAHLARACELTRRRASGSSAPAAGAGVDEAGEEHRDGLAQLRARPAGRRRRPHVARSSNTFSGRDSPRSSWRPRSTSSRAGGQPVVHDLGGGLRQDGGAARREGPQPRGAVEGGAEVVAAPLVRLARVQRDPHAQVEPAGPGGRRERVAGARRRTATASEARGNTVSVESPSPLAFSSRPPCASRRALDELVVQLERGRHRLGVGLPERGRALDVGQQERHHAGGEPGGAPAPPAAASAPPRAPARAARAPGPARGSRLELAQALARLDPQLLDERRRASW